MACKPCLRIKCHNHVFITLFVKEFKTLCPFAVACAYGNFSNLHYCTVAHLFLFYSCHVMHIPIMLYSVAGCLACLTVSDL